MEEPNISQLTGTVTFSRKVSVRPYETADASIAVQFQIPTSGTADEQRTQLLGNARAAFFAAKAIVFEELGLEFSVEEGGVIREVLAKALGRVTEVAANDSFPEFAPTLQIVPSVVASATMTAAPFAADTQDKAERTANKRWATARILSNPEEWWDNRDNKRNPKAPDYKHKDTGMGVWL